MPPLSPLAELPILDRTKDDASTGPYFGIFRESPDHARVADEAAADLRRVPASVMRFVGWRENSLLPFPDKDVRGLVAKHVLPHLTWEPWVKLADINAGKYDDYIHAWAANAKAVDAPILIRFGHEMNGNWYPWAIGHEGVTAEDFKAAYRRVHDLFVADGAAKVQWIWCFNNDSTPASNDPAAAYPGDAYVDWVGIDAYNWGTNGPSGRWSSFHDVFATAYAKAQVIAPRKPIALAEFASSEIGGNKAAWIDAMFDALETDFPQVRLFTWFDINKEQDWRIGSTDSARERFVIGLRRKHIHSDGDALALVAAEMRPPVVLSSRVVADFESATDTDVRSNDGGAVRVAGYQADASKPTTCTSCGTRNPLPVVEPAGADHTRRVAFDFATQAPNAYAGALLTIDLLGHKPDGSRASADVQGYDAIMLRVSVSGIAELRVDLVGDSSLGLPDGGHPQATVRVGAAPALITIPFKRFAQPSWANPQRPLADVLAKLVAVQIGAHAVPAFGHVTVDDVSFARLAH